MTKRVPLEESKHTFVGTETYSSERIEMFFESTKVHSFERVSMCIL